MRRAVLSFLFCSLCACGGEPQEEPTPRVPATPRVEREETDAAIERAIAYLEPRIDNPHVCLFLGSMRRRFDLQAFADLPRKYDELLAGGGPSPDFLALRRILHPKNVCPPAILAMIVSEANRVLGPALYCDRGEYPPNYRGTLRGAVDEGGYALTHAGLALAFMEAYGCDPPVHDPRNFKDKVVTKMAALLDASDGTSDLEMESAAFLHLLGRGDLVPAGFVAAARAAQMPDGGWPGVSVLASDWHATAVGLWLLLETSRGEEEKRSLVKKPR